MSASPPPKVELEVLEELAQVRDRIEALLVGAYFVTPSRLRLLSSRIIGVARRLEKSEIGESW